MLNRPGACAVPAVARRGRAVNFRPFARLDDQRPWGDQAGDFGIPELAEQTENIAIDRLAPKLLAGVEIPADARGADARVDGSGIKRQQSPFAVADDTDRMAAASGVGAEPIDGGEHFL